MENLHDSKDCKNILFSSIQSKIAIRDGAHYSRTCCNKCFFLKILPCILWLTSVEFFVLAKINCNAICTDISLHFAVCSLLKHIQKWNYSALWRCRLTFRFSSKFVLTKYFPSACCRLIINLMNMRDRMFVNSFHFPYTIFVFFYSDNFWIYDTTIFTFFLADLKLALSLSLSLKLSVVLAY